MSKDTLVVAHNAGFDRPVIEQRFVRNDGPMSEVIESMPWGCTNKEIDWRGLGYEGTKLEINGGYWSGFAKGGLTHGDLEGKPKRKGENYFPVFSRCFGCFASAVEK